MSGVLPYYCFELYCSNNVRKLYHNFEKSDLDEWVSSLKRYNELILKKSSIDKRENAPPTPTQDNRLHTERSLLATIQGTDPKNKGKLMILLAHGLCD